MIKRKKLLILRLFQNFSFEKATLHLKRKTGPLTGFPEAIFKTNRVLKMALLFGLFSIVITLSQVKAQEAEKNYPPFAIINASYRGDEQTVREILAAGIDKNVRDAFGDTALHVAIYQSNITIVKLLLDYGFDPNARATKTGNTPLHNAVAANNIEAAQLLLQYGANKNIKALDGLTPLDRAKKDDKRNFVMLLYK